MPNMKDKYLAPSTGINLCGNGAAVRLSRSGLRGDYSRQLPCLLQIDNRPTLCTGLCASHLPLLSLLVLTLVFFHLFLNVGGEVGWGTVYLHHHFAESGPVLSPESE